MEICIKNMVCERCILFVSEIFREEGFPNAYVKLGKVSIDDTLSEKQLRRISYRLYQFGFKILFDPRHQLTERIKKLTFYFVYHKPENRKMNFSDFLSTTLKKDYTFLSSLFSSVEGITIEKYRIALKIERVKELISENKKTLSKIASDLGYSSLAHLSGQFKNVTGITPTEFKKTLDKPLNQRNHVNKKGKFVIIR